MRHVSLVLAMLLALVVAGPAALAQVETPAPAISATPLPVATATPVANLADVAPLPLTGERRSTFEAYVAEAVDRLGVPGASVAVVKGGDVVYAQGFGVRELGGTDPVTPDTLMMIGSVTKSMTSTMAATVVDDGWLSWDTPLVDLLPDFAVADPDLTPRLTVADAFCACTGLARRDLELIFQFNDLTPERLLAQVAELPLTAPYGGAVPVQQPDVCHRWLRGSCCGGCGPDGPLRWLPVGDAATAPGSDGDATLHFRTG